MRKVKFNSQPENDGTRWAPLDVLQLLPDPQDAGVGIDGEVGRESQPRGIQPVADAARVGIVPVESGDGGNLVALK